MRRLCLLLLVLPAWATAQPKTYRVSTDQRVENGHLLIDVFIERTAGGVFSLASSNFSFYLTAGPLDIANAEIAHSEDGPWTDATDNQGYLPLGLYKRAGFVVLNVNCKSQFESLDPGPGQPVPPTRVRIGRVRVPIADPSGYNTLTWRLEPAAINRWDGTNIKDEGDFVTPAPNFPLCEIPAAPVLLGPADTLICSHQPLTLRSSYAGAVHRWFRDGTLVAGAEADTLVVALPGRYTAVAYNYSCVSDTSNSQQIGVRFVTEPVLRRENRLLVANVSQDVTWYRNGQRIAGASGDRYVLRESGTYHVTTPSDCGTLRSNEILVDFNSEPLVTADSSNLQLAFGAYPNPYPSWTYLSFTLERATRVVIDITTPSGVHITRLVDQPHDAGKYKVRFSAQELGQPTGTYIARLVTDYGVEVIKVVEGA